MLGNRTLYREQTHKLQWSHEITMSLALLGAHDSKSGELREKELGGQIGHIAQGRQRNSRETVQRGKETTKRGESETKRGKDNERERGNEKRREENVKRGDGRERKT